MSEKLFSDPRWWAPFPVENVGHRELTKEEEIEALEYWLEAGDISIEEYKEELAKIEAKHAASRGSDE